MDHTKKQTKNCILLLTGLTLALFVSNYDGKLDSYNASILALSYRYGFIARGLIGSFYDLLNLILPVDLMNYTAALHFTQVVTGLFFAFLIGFGMFLIQKAKDRGQRETFVLVVILLILCVPTFSAERNFGRVDLYMILFSCIGVMLLVAEKAQWLVIPLGCLAVMVHQGYVFMYFNLILALLLYRLITNEKKRKYYGILLGLSFVTVSALFLYLELFSHSNGASIYDTVVANAKALSPEGDYHKSLIAHEILGVDPSEDEWEYHLRNFVEGPLLAVLLLPYIILGIRILKEMLVTCEDKWQKRGYLLIAIGSLTILPDLIVKCDYGRWMLAVLVYYVVILTAELAMGDQLLLTAMEHQVESLKKRFSWWPLLLVYPLLFVPFWDVNINKMLATISHEINLLILHWW